MRWRSLVAVFLLWVQSAGAGGLFDLAAEERWEVVLQVAAVRARQMPLSTEESLVVGYAAGVLDDPREVDFLRRAVGDDGPGQIGRLLLAGASVDRDPDRAAELALPLVRKGASREVRDEAVEVVRRALEAGVSETCGRSVRDGIVRASRQRRRSLLAAVAATAGAAGRRDLERVLRGATGDRAALVAARGLESLGPHDPTERWLLAKTYFRHGLYEEAAAHLEPLERAGSGGPEWEVAFVLGRCAFRGERWSEACRLYRASLGRAHGAERRADLLVHLARASELAGDASGALDAARRAVRERATDGRRLFAARLELVHGNRRAAVESVARCRATVNRDRGRLLVVLDDLERRRVQGALEGLDRLSSAAWAAVGDVLAAELLVRRAQFRAALEKLRSATASGLSPFWELRARGVARQLPRFLLDEWRRELAQARSEASELENMRLLAEHVVLETAASVRARLRSQVVDLLVPADGSTPAPERGLAGALWALGLHRAAARWDPGSFPRGGLVEAAWSAKTLNRLGATDRAMVLADEVRRRLLSRGPVSVLPRPVLEALYPLPHASAARAAARETGVPWELLAAVVREESRWDVDAVSAVGARGLTQLMPATAARVAQTVGEDLAGAESLFVPETALRLGGLELRRLLAAFDNRPGPAVAAYNAGEGPVRVWWAACPEPRSAGVFVATIGYSATRLYTADVLASAEWYRELYGEEGAPASGVQSR